MPKTKSREPSYSLETIDGRQLRVAHWKYEGPPSGNLPLLFFNGIGANIELVAPFAEDMDDRDFLIFDMPGIGGSPEPAIPYNAILMARISALLLDRFDMPLVDVMGVSWGGAMAQHFALQHGSRVNRLILAATTAGMLMIPGKIASLRKMADPRRYIDPNYMRRNFETLYGGSADGKSDHAGRMKPPSKIGYFYQLLAMAGWTSAPFLPFLSKPTLIMMGGSDKIVPVINGKFLRTLIPNSELIILEGGGHLFMLSHREECLTVIREFLGRDRDADKAEAA